MLASAHVADFYTMIARRYAKYGWRRITKAYLKMAEQERADRVPSLILLPQISGRIYRHASAD